MRKAKRILSILIAAVVMFGAVKIPMVARAAAGDGMMFEQDRIYYTDKVLGNAPRTMEAVIKLPTDYYASKKGGVIIGNHGSGKNTISLEINTWGAPAIRGYNNGVFFEEVMWSQGNNSKICSGNWVHLAIVFESPTTVACYIDGVRQQRDDNSDGVKDNTYEIHNADKITDYITNSNFPMILGGDTRYADGATNGEYFKGNIKSVALYSDARTAEEIASDVTAYGTDDLILRYDMSSYAQNPSVVEDLSNNGFDARYEKWTDSKDYVSVTDYDFSVAVVGDTQCINDENQKRYRLEELYDWIADNADSKKMKYVLGLGDITENQVDNEWAYALTNLKKLDGKVPYSLVRGNHDNSQSKTSFTSQFSYPEYTSQICGYYDENSLDNVWMEFSNDGLKYMVMVLDYGPSDEVLEWAGDVIEAHPGHNVIITTHGYLFRDGTTLDADGAEMAPPSNTGGINNGDDIWEKLGKKYANISMILSGHDPNNDIVVTQTNGDNGNTVTQMLIDPQDMDERYQNLGEDPTGMVAMFYFSNGGKTVDIEYYSTIRDAYWGETIHLDNVNVVDSGEEICSHKELKHYPKVDATPTENGQLEHWVCQSCEVKFRDAACTMVVTDVVIPSYGNAGGKLEIAGASVTLEDKVLLNVVVDKTTLDNGEYVKPYVRVSLNGDETTIRSYAVTEDTYIFTYGGVAPHQMNDTLCITLCAESRGIMYSSETRTYSVGEYCYNTLRDTEYPASKELKALLVDLLNYGAAAQNYHGYRTDALVNSSLTDSEKEYGSDGTLDLTVASASAGEDGAVVWKSATLILNNAVGLRFKVDIGTESVENLSVQIKDNQGNVYSGCTTRFHKIEGSQYYIFVDGLAITEMEKELCLSIRKAIVEEDDAGNSTTTYTTVSKVLNYSVATYASKKMNDTTNLGRLMKALMYFGNSAVAYKESL